MMHAYGTGHSHTSCAAVGDLDTEGADDRFFRIPAGGSTAAGIFMTSFPPSARIGHFCCCLRRPRCSTLIDSCFAGLLSSSSARACSCRSRPAPGLVLPPRARFLLLDVGSSRSVDVVRGTAALMFFCMVGPPVASFDDRHWFACTNVRLALYCM
jgi:hypothetical protein